MTAHPDPSYVAIIPYPVLNHPDLSDGAKLLFGRITMLQRSGGYCYATNEYLAEQVKKKPDTVSRLVSQLRNAGFLRVELIRNETTNEITERRLYPVVDTAPPSWKKIQEGIGKKSNTPIGKKAEENIKIIEVSPPKAPQGGRRRRETKEAPDHEPERFSKFWEFYPRHESKQAAIRAWDKLRPSGDLIDKMAKALKVQIKSKAWQEGIGIPYASTWLNNRRWEDEVKAAPVAQMSTVDTRGGLEAW